MAFVPRPGHPDYKQPNVVVGKVVVMSTEREPSPALLPAKGSK